jgi:hypothetical protein
MVPLFTFATQLMVFSRNGQTLHPIHIYNYPAGYFNKKINAKNPQRCFRIRTAPPVLPDNPMVPHFVI